MIATTSNPKEFAEDDEATLDASSRRKMNGPAGAIIAAGIGLLVLRLAATSAVMIPAPKAALTFYEPVGPLSAKTTAEVVVCPIVWFIWARM